ncbi:MAG: hypothetical protein S0880_02170 [Actinomycetota bacterium]|nr:hypothetical protein [Actinomycetota bacterium]
MSRGNDPAPDPGPEPWDDPNWYAHYRNDYEPLQGEPRDRPTLSTVGLGILRAVATAAVTLWAARVWIQTDPRRPDPPEIELWVQLLAIAVLVGLGAVLRRTGDPWLGFGLIVGLAAPPLSVLAWLVLAAT